MALDFPSNPVVGQLFGNYVWTGTAWAAQGSTNNVGTQIAALQAAMPIGKIVQIVTGSTQAFASNSTQTYVDTGLTATITPQSSTNKVLVIVEHVSTGKSGGTTTCVQIRTMRGATQIMDSGDGLTYAITTEVRGIGYHETVLDSPATTSAVTYKTQFRQPQPGGLAAWVTVGANSPSTSRITLVEVKI